MKDLPDLALLASAQESDAKRLRAAITFRETHALPVPAESWVMPYEAMARRDGLRWTTVEDVTQAVLAGGLDARWPPTARSRR